MYHTQSFFQRHPISLVLLALAPITAALSMTTVAHAKDKSTDASVEEFDANNESSTSELRVAPLDHTEYPDDRPEWIDEADNMVGVTHTRVAISSPSETEEESLESLRLMRDIEIDLYANELITFNGHGVVFQLDKDWIADNADRFVSKEYKGTLKRGDVEHFEHAVQLRFTPELQNEIRLQWKRVEVGHRLGTISFLIFVGTVLTGCGSAALGIFSRRIERSATSSSNVG